MTGFTTEGFTGRLFFSEFTIAGPLQADSRKMINNGHRQKLADTREKFLTKGHMENTISPKQVKMIDKKREFLKGL